jgi:hypothetical protein
MAIRRQTVVLLVVLLAVGLVSLLHHRHVEPEPPTVNLIAPTPSSLRATFAHFKVPRGFHRSTRCWLPGKDIECFVRLPSIPLDTDAYGRLLSEVGATTSEPPACVATPRRRPLRGSHSLRWVICNTFGGDMTVNREIVSVSGYSLVRFEHGRVEGVEQPWKIPNGAILRGTQIDLFDIGVRVVER